MTEIFTSLTAVLLMLILTAVGYIFGRLGWIKHEGKGFFAKFLINLCIPCVCVSKVFSYFSREMFDDMGLLILVPFLGMTVSTLLAWGAAVLFKVPYRHRGTFAAIAGLSNTIFVGLPVCNALFGDAGTPYALIYYIVNSFTFWTIGYALLRHYGNSEESTGKSGFLDILKKIMSAPLVTMLVCLPLVYFGIKPPDIIIKAAGHFASCATPVGLMYIGYIVYESGKWRMDGSLALMAGFRFIIAPAIALLLCWLFGITDVARGVFTVQAAMPAMTQAVVITAATGGDEKYAMEGVTITTVLCFVVIPVLMMIL